MYEPPMSRFQVCLLRSIGDLGKNVHGTLGPRRIRHQTPLSLKLLITIVLPIKVTNDDISFLPQLIHTVAHC
jgi:hypothetical protein